MAAELRVYRSLTEVGDTFGPCALTIGNFDGVHRGHQEIFRRVVAAARASGWTAAALTFDPHPARVVAPDRAPPMLSSVEQRTQWMGEQGITAVIVLPFDDSVAALKPEVFVRSILVERLRMRAVFLGPDFRFGHRAAGDVSLLTAMGAQLGFAVETVQPVKRRGLIVSSTEIRRRILRGQAAAAARLLGRFYSLEGRVVPGEGVGSRQTVPTLNMETDNEVLPGRGVYVTRTTDCDRKRCWPSVTNVGYRPTFGGDRLTIETFLLAPLDDSTPARIRVEFTHHLRDERRFDSPEALKTQIMRDVRRAQTWHRRFGLLRAKTER